MEMNDHSHEYLLSELKALSKAVTNNEELNFSSNKSVFDADGQELKLLALDDKLLPCFGEGNIRKVKDIKLRDDDVILLGYPKTGCHWIWEVLNMMLRKTPVMSKLGKEAVFLEFASLENIENTPSPRALNSHLWFDYLPQQLLEKKTKLILTFRNPKDTAVSFYNHTVSFGMVLGYQGTFKSWFPLFEDGLVDYGSYYDYYLEWDHVIKSNPDLQVLLVSYEEMKEDLTKVMKKMSKFLDLDLDDQLAQDIVKATRFDAMKETYTNNGTFSRSLLRKGQVGDWKNWLTVAQSEAVDEKMKKLDGTSFSQENQRYTL
ncbi:sulfotransferase 6B1-like [Physella acuta]|uniref:sulfotransferase 6B1-like n=1 Tax=Physella acuta TaxID=109671 RepID=UPI0027DE0E95|nr:sulfotransferase 6B1-like [Physella acuta]